MTLPASLTEYSKDSSSSIASGQMRSKRCSRKIATPLDDPNRIAAYHAGTQKRLVPATS